MVDIRAGLGRALAGHLRWYCMGEAKVVLARLQVEADGGEDNDDIASYVSQVESQLRLPGGKPKKLTGRTKPMVMRGQCWTIR